MSLTLRETSPLSRHLGLRKTDVASAQILKHIIKEQFHKVQGQASKNVQVVKLAMADNHLAFEKWSSRPQFLLEQERHQQLHLPDHCACITTSGLMLVNNEVLPTPEAVIAKALVPNVRSYFGRADMLYMHHFALMIAFCVRFESHLN